MTFALVTHGEMIDPTTIKLKEPIPVEKGSLRIIIEKETNSMKKISFGMAKGKIEILPEFYDPIEDFKEYL
ncbi:MAG TPA: hypothetical protein PK200_17265 [Spirochaetota bacterium]|nr:hypothetical protein [Spirochaetota bacterium]HQO02742.1 hypothetical protein [Spirochaetota bacterium]HQP49953.1 hypothetical protein [Spirochaetota bacterium]